MRIVVVGTDLGKNSCSLVGLSENGTVVLRRRLCREGVIAFVGQLPACVVAIALAEFGHVVHLVSPAYVRPYVKAQKNDGRDAEAIAEAATRPAMRFAELKSEEQLDMQTLHRVRDRLVAERDLVDQPDPVLASGAGTRRGTGACLAARCPHGAARW
jgi:transposase